MWYAFSTIKKEGTIAMTVRILNGGIRRAVCFIAPLFCLLFIAAPLLTLASNASGFVVSDDGHVICTVGDFEDPYGLLEEALCYFEDSLGVQPYIFISDAETVAAQARARFDTIAAESKSPCFLLPVCVSDGKYSIGACLVSEDARWIMDDYVLSVLERTFGEVSEEFSGSPSDASAEVLAEVFNRLTEETESALYDGKILCAVDGLVQTDGALKKAVTSFARSTGAAPYVYITDRIGEETAPEDWKVDSFVNALFAGLPPQEPSSFLLVLLWDGEGLAAKRCKVGEDAEWIMTGERCESLSFLLNSTFEAPQTQSFEDALASVFNALKNIFSEEEKRYGALANGETVVYYELGDGEDYENALSIYNSLNTYDTGFDFEDLLTFLPLLIVLPAALVIRFAKKSMEEDRRSAADARAIAAERAARNAEAAARQPSVQVYEPLRYPVTCPGCGATAYPNKDGTCQYCGRAITPKR